MADDTAQDDERNIELSSIAAIFPEIVLDQDKPFTASIDLPVVPSVAVPVSFPESSDGTPLDPQRNADAGHEIHHLSHLPSLHLHIDLPEGYPATLPPNFEVSTSPQWLSPEILVQLQQDGVRLWEEFGHDQVLFAYIDHLQQSAENAFGVLDGHEFLQILPEHKISLLDYDIKSKREAFEKETFDCGVCLDPKKGSVCHKMIDCGHVFCVACLQDFYNNAIQEGDITSVKCLAPDCAKKRNQDLAAIGKRRKVKAQLSPSELLQIPLGHEIVKRYVDLKHKAELESDKNTIYCPRKWCQGAARSKKHKKPTNWESVEDSDGDTDDENEQTTDSDGKPKTFSPTDRLCICEDCSFAFCSRCFQGWHGELTLCIPRTNTGELTEEDKASMEYLRLHTTPCPTCAAPAQKTHGCNHMICFRCNTHFCYLCSAWLDPSNPYKHFNIETTSCYMRLWELEGGDGDDVGIGYVGGDNIPPEENEHDDPVVERARDEPAAQHEEQVPANRRPAEANRQRAEPAVAREGPLVLRLEGRPIDARPEAEVGAPHLRQQQREALPHQQQQEPRPRAEVHRPGGYLERQPGRRHAAAIAARRAAQPQQPRRRYARQQAEPNRNAGPGAGAGAGDNVVRAADQEEANRAWVQNFVQMALNDQEDEVEWNSDDEDDVAAWEIPVR